MAMLNIPQSCTSSVFQQKKVTIALLYQYFDTSKLITQACCHTRGMYYEVRLLFQNNKSDTIHGVKSPSDGWLNQKLVGEKSNLALLYLPLLYTTLMSLIVCSVYSRLFQLIVCPLVAGMQQCSVLQGAMKMKCIT